MSDPLLPLRNNIDAIDKQIIDLLAERYKNVAEIGRIKRTRHLPIYVPEREKALMTKLKQYNNGRLADSTLDAIYREVISGAIKTGDTVEVRITDGKPDFVITESN